jgi:hypothetical protein
VAGPRIERRRPRVPDAPVGRGDNPSGLPAQHGLPTEEPALDDVRGGLDLDRRARPGAEHAEERHHHDGFNVDVAEASRSEVTRQLPSPPVKWWRVVDPERRVLEDPVDATSNS